MNPDLDLLQPYPFERLARLKQGLTPPGDLPHIPLSLGEPRHPTPRFIAEALLAHLHGIEERLVGEGRLEHSLPICTAWRPSQPPREVSR